MAKLPPFVAKMWAPLHTDTGRGHGAVPGRVAQGRGRSTCDPGTRLFHAIEPTFYDNENERSLAVWFLAARPPRGARGKPGTRRRTSSDRPVRAMRPEHGLQKPVR